MPIPHGMRFPDVRFNAGFQILTAGRDKYLTLNIEIRFRIIVKNDEYLCRATRTKVKHTIVYTLDSWITLIKNIILLSPNTPPYEKSCFHLPCTHLCGSGSCRMRPGTGIRYPAGTCVCSNVRGNTNSNDFPPEALFFHERSLPEEDIRLSE
jgi:hypothetical protein